MNRRFLYIVALSMILLFSGPVVFYRVVHNHRFRQAISYPGSPLAFWSSTPQPPPPPPPFRQEQVCCPVETEKDIVVPQAKMSFLLVTSGRLDVQVRKFGLGLRRIRIEQYNPGRGTISPDGSICSCCLLGIDKDRFATGEIQFVGLLEHEFAHIVFCGNSEYQAKAKQFFGRMSPEERTFFTEYNYIADGGGHPWENENELFASSFALASLEQEDYLPKGTVKPPAGVRQEFWQWINTLPLFRVRIDPYPVWPAPTPLPSSFRFDQPEFRRSF